MESTLNFVSIIIIVFGILQIILFFKLWGMTNDIKEIKNKYVGKVIVPEVNTFHNPNIAFNIGDIVIYTKTGDKFRIDEIAGENIYKCSSVGGGARYVLNGGDLRR